jgi:hypothetical protein
LEKEVGLMARDDRHNNYDSEPDDWERNALTEEQKKLVADWSHDDALAALNLERDMRPEETPEELTKRIFREGAPVAASRIVRVALTSPNERVAMDASKYIIDRTLGRVGDNGEAVDPLTEFMKKVEDAANAGSGN